MTSVGLYSLPSPFFLNCKKLIIKITFQFRVGIDHFLASFIIVRYTDSITVSYVG